MFRISYSIINSETKHAAIGCVDVDLETLPEAEDAALIECRMCLSWDKIMLEYVDDLFYSVFNGLDCIGGVKIRSL